jgi:lambda family phage portal protein
LNTSLVGRIQLAWRALKATNGHGPTNSRGGRWDFDAGGPRWSGGGSNPVAPNQFWDNPAIGRARAESLYRNNPFARKAVDAIVNAVMGANAIHPQFPDRQTQSAWSEWCERPDIAGRLDYTGISLQVAQTVAVSGEAFVLLLLDPAAAGNPLRVQCVGPEFLDTSRTDDRTLAGIQFEGQRPSGYWLYDRHPSSVGFRAESRFVPASNCLHVYRPIAPGAQRGQSWLAPVVLPLKDLDEYLEAALIHQKIASLYSGFIQTNEGDNPLAGKTGVPSLEPGSMTRLKPGEIVEFSKPPDPGSAFDPFVRSQLRRIAAGVGVPYEVLSGDLSAVTFASGRHGLLEWSRTIEALQYGLFVPMFCEPVLQAWLRTERALSGEEPGAKPIKPVRWIAPRIEMLDPSVETADNVANVRAGFTSRSEVVAKRGWRVDDIDAEIAADNARADRLGLVLDSDPRRVTAQGQTQQTPKPQDQK